LQPPARQTLAKKAHHSKVTRAVSFALKSL